MAKDDLRRLGEDGEGERLPSHPLSKGTSEKVNSLLKETQPEEENPVHFTIENILKGEKVVSARELLNLLSEYLLKDNEPIKIGQRTIDPQVAKNHLQQALGIVQEKFAAKFNLDLNNLDFTIFSGDQVGESTSQGEFVDIIMLMHSALALSFVIAHELAHNKRLILEEGVIEALLDEFFPTAGVEETNPYIQAKKDFLEFAKVFNPEGNLSANIIKIFELFLKYKGSDEVYDAIFDYPVFANYLKTLSSQEQDEIFALFIKAFQCVNYLDDGAFVREIPSVEELKPKSSGEKPGDNVVALASKRVGSTSRRFLDEDEDGAEDKNDYKVAT